MATRPFYPKIGIPIPGNNFILRQGHDIQSINYFIHPLPPTNTTYQYTTHRIKALWFHNFHTNIQVFIKSSWSIYPSLATWLTPNSWWKVALCLVPESLEVLSVVCPAKYHGWGGLRCHVQQCWAYTPGGPKRGCTAVPVHYAHMAGLLRRPYGAPLQQPVTLHGGDTTPGHRHTPLGLSEGDTQAFSHLPQYRSHSHSYKPNTKKILIN